MLPRPSDSDANPIAAQPAGPAAGWASQLCHYPAGHADIDFEQLIISQPPSERGIGYHPSRKREKLRVLKDT